jgi:hypothetical protein
MQMIIRSLFQHHNKNLFNNSLKIPRIEIDFDRKFIMRWIEDTIYVGVEIAAISLPELHCHIVHEMVHISNADQNIEDVGVNQYHNKLFCNKCLNLGFFVVRHWTQGWSLNTTLPLRNVRDKNMFKFPTQHDRENLLKVIKEFKLHRSEFSNNIACVRSQISAKTPSKTFFLKYVCQCPSPHNSIRSGRRPDGRNSLDIKCKRCNCDFNCVSPLV